MPKETPPNPVQKFDLSTIKSGQPFVLPKDELSPGKFRIVEPAELAERGLLKKEAKPLKSKEMNQGLSLEEAESIIGTERFFGLQEINTALNINLESLPNIPIPQEELERARQRGEILIYLPSQTSDGTQITGQWIHDSLSNHPRTRPKANATDPDPKILYKVDWYALDPFYTQETIRPGWRLIPENSFILKDNQGQDSTPTTSLNYATQTEALAMYITKVAYEDLPIPPAIQDALDQWQTEKASILSQIDSTDETIQKALSQKLTNLAINQIFRNSLVEDLATALIADTKGIHTLGQAKNIKDTTYWQFRWTNSRTLDGKLVLLGYFDADGARVNGRWPRSSVDDLGAAFSRNEFLDSGF